MANPLSKLLRVFLKEDRIWEIKNRNNIPSMEWSLMHIKKLGFESAFAVDVGAYDGEWTEMYKKIFPEAVVLMVEAQYEKENQLKAVTEKLPGTHFHICLLGATKGQPVTFYVNSTVSSVLKEHQPNTFVEQQRQLETLTAVIENHQLGQPDFIKLDVQGYEIEILKGATAILDNAQFVLSEISLIDINQDCPLFAEVIAFMDQKGFSVYDICSFMRRPLDRALWQTDVLFIRKTHPLIQNKYWG
ncbi:MAG TPA: FkbM family methyltransferase [Mucilaginibacter sp.]|jgi:FkbM family methyltransferase|nr:FkbM family methyltransferase [Mucilaginibacter sp.]